VEGDGIGKIQTEIENNENVYFFLVFSTESLLKKEEVIQENSTDNPIIKNSLKKVKKNHFLYSNDQEDLEKWRKEISSMVKRRTGG